MDEPKKFVVRYYELHTVMLTAPTIAEVATQAEAIVKKLPPGSRMLDIHVVPEDLVA